MTTTRITRDGKRIIMILSHYTDGTIAELKKHLQYGLIKPEDFTVAKLDYNCSEGCPIGFLEEVSKLPDFYPLKFHANNSELWCSAVTAGYRGEGPHGSLEALKLMGFNLSDEEKEILFTDKDAHLTYTK